MVLNRIYITLIFWLSIAVAHAQFGFEFAPDVPVLQSGQPMDFPWAGGLNNAQISDFDFDFDGDLDLFIFDRSRDNIRVLIQENGMGGPYYRYQHGTRAFFPDDVRYRAQLIDYDADGRKDLFTYGIGGLKVYRNVGDAMNGLQWELITDLLYSQYVSNYTNLYVSSTDIPAIIDVDFDGDIDILTFHQGGQHVEYHQNQSMELYGIPDSLIFELKNECWGLFTEEFSTNTLILNDPNAPCVGGSIPNPLRESEVQHLPKHAGSTLLAMDYDNSGVMDLVLGDVSYPTMTLLLNGGTAPNTNSAMISQDNSFPSNTTPISIQLFPAAFYVDVDFDSKRDLVVGANARNISENERSVLYYKNIGTDANPTFSFVQRDLFQDQMIDHGAASVPVLHDWNEDGLEDLLVANFYRYKPVLNRDAAIAYYQNTGTIDAPQFTFVDDDLLNLSSAGYGLHMIPTFGDLDGDADEDMILGLEDGTLAYFENTSSGSGSVYGIPILNYTDNLGAIIQHTGLTHPQLLDLNNDNLLDLVIGRKNGEIVYYENIGTLGAPSFELHNPTLGNIDVSTTTPDGFAAPHFFKVNDTLRLFLGSIDGQLIYYDSIENNLDPGENFRLVSDQYIGIDVEGYSAFSVGEIDNDGNLHLFVGQDLGGVNHYEANPNSSATLKEVESYKFSLYPNPTDGLFHIYSEETMERVVISDLHGKLIVDRKCSDQEISLDTGNIASGVYIVRVFTTSGNFGSSRIIKR